MLDFKQQKTLAETVLGLGRKLAAGAELAVSLRAVDDGNTRFAKSEITSSAATSDVAVDVSVAFGKRRGSASANQIDPQSLTALVSQAARLARVAPEDPELMPVLGPQRVATIKAAWDPGSAGLGAKARAEAAKTAIAAGDAGRLEIAGYYEHAQAVRTVATSAGLFAQHRDTRVGFSLTARSADGSGSGWAQATSARALDIDVDRRVQIAVAKAEGSRTPRPLSPGKYTVVLEPAAVAELVGFMTGAMEARQADEGRSFFSKAGGGTRLGETLFPASITVRSDPNEAGAPSAPFASDGQPLVPTSWVERGTIKTLARSRYWAQKTVAPAVPRPGLWIMEPGSASSAELVAGVKRGVLITRFWYTRWVDPRTILITGLTRDGVFLIEDGRVTTPVNNFRFNESPVTMLARAEALSKERELVGGVLAPALRTTEFNLASVSDAV
jgi:predicted Zn-dependent protease